MFCKLPSSVLKCPSPFLIGPLYSTAFQLNNSLTTSDILLMQILNIVPIEVSPSTLKLQKKCCYLWGKASLRQKIKKFPATQKLKVVILLKSLVTMHATKDFFTSVNSFVYFHIDGRNDGFLSCMASSMAIPFGQWE